MTSSHPLSHKTISEIGGGILEEYISKAIKESFSKNSDYFVNYLSSRSLGDFFVQSKKSATTIYFDIKSQHLSIREKTYEYYINNNIQQKKPGESHPNLISYQKAKDFYSSIDRQDDDIGMIFVKYDPEISGSTINFKIMDFSNSSIFLLRDISTNNLSYGNLGKGQIQLSRINNLRIDERNKSEFLKTLDFLKNKPRQTRRSPTIWSLSSTTPTGPIDWGKMNSENWKSLILWADHGSPCLEGPIPKLGEWGKQANKFDPVSALGAASTNPVR